jgi:hypothetical protein
MTESSVVELVDLDERDQDIFDQRLAGKSIRAIARQFRISMKEVDNIVEAHCTPVTLEQKAKAYELELMRIDQMQLAAYEKARKGNISAIMAVAKLMERRAAMIGYEAPVRHDPIQVLAQATPVTSTERIQLVLDQLVEQKRQAEPELDIGGEE